ncbi:MAG: outer membrane lipoprotein carrier protein LolA [Treponema sp.]|nr:outer membrane lipoprotein carrier protein LolA [Treponema sp.]
MKRKSKILFLCLFFIISSVWAQEDVFRYPLTAQTMNTFNTTFANLAEKPIIKGNFVQEKYLNRFDRSLVSSGNFIIAVEQGMVWETLKPFPSTMILGKNFIMQSRPDGRKSVISAQGNETFTQMADVISVVFSGQSQGLLENFKVYFLGSVSNWNMGLLPRDSAFASFVAKITMSGDSAIRSIRLFEQSGDFITYTFSNLSNPSGLSDHEEAFFSIP